MRFEAIDGDDVGVLCFQTNQNMTVNQTITHLFICYLFSEILWLNHVKANETCIFFTRTNDAIMFLDSSAQGNI